MPINNSKLPTVEARIDAIEIVLKSLIRSLPDESTRALLAEVRSSISFLRTENASYLAERSEMVVSCLADMLPEAHKGED